MARSVVRTDLPSLTQLIPHFSGFSASWSKRSQIAELLKELILTHRKPRSQNFYPLREIADFFEVSIRTANLAVLDLRHEGLLITARGSHTRIPGTREWGNRYVRAVVGMPLWAFGLRFSHLHKFFPILLSENLDEQDLVLDTIIFTEIADRRSNFDRQLAGHRMDFTLWLFPFAHNRSSIQNLEDAGIPQILIEHEADLKVGEAAVQVCWESSLREILQFWITKYEIRNIVIPIGTEYDRKRETHLIRIAAEMGLVCETQACTPDTARTLLERYPPPESKVGVALLDEHSSAEFCFFSPEDTRKVFEHHRILLANNSINIPYVPDQILSYERIVMPEAKLQRAVSRVLQRHLSQDPHQEIERIQTKHDLEWPLHRYI